MPDLTDDDFDDLMEYHRDRTIAVMMGDVMPTPPGCLSDDGLAEGERRRDAAHALLRDRRAVLVRQAQRALLLRLLDAGTATADDVRAAVPLPPGVGPRVYGAVPTPLAAVQIIRHAGYTPTRRPEGHARPTAVWMLADRAGAPAWLAAHPELPPVDDDATTQPTLY